MTNPIQLIKFSILSFIVIILTGCGPDASDLPLNDYAAHQDYQDKNGRSKLVNEYEDLLANNPNSPYPYYYLSRIIENNPERKISLSIAGIQTDPWFSFNYLMTSVAYREKMELDSSRAFLDRAGILGLPEDFFNVNKFLIRYAEDLSKGLTSEESLINYYRYRSSELDLITSEIDNLLKSGYQVLTLNGSTFDLNDVSYRYTRAKSKVRALILCSSTEQETFLKRRYSSLGKAIFEFSLMNQPGECAYVWYVVSTNDYGGISSCIVTTGINQSTLEIDVLSVRCD